ncbi:MAG: CvpA family protein [Acidobacteriaceae bacterium]
MMLAASTAIHAATQATAKTMLAQSTLDQIASRMTTLDWIILAIVVLSTLAGLISGLLRAVCSLIGLLAGFMIAAWNYKTFASRFLNLITDKGLAEVIAFLFIVIGVMLLAGLVGGLLRGTARIVGLAWLDSLLGGVFGFLRGCLLAGASMMSLAAFLPASLLLTGSTFAPFCLGLAHQMAVFAPADLQQRVAEGARRIERGAEGFKLH